MAVRKVVLKSGEQTIAEVVIDSEVVLLFSHYFSSSNPSAEDIKKFIISLKRKVKPASAVDNPAIMLKLFEAIGKAMEELSKEAEKIEVVVE